METKEERLEELHRHHLELSEAVGMSTVDDAIKFFKHGHREAQLFNTLNGFHCPVTHYFLRKAGCGVYCSYYFIVAFTHLDDEMFKDSPIIFKPTSWERRLQDAGFNESVTDSYGLPHGMLTSHAIVDILEKIKVSG